MEREHRLSRLGRWYVFAVAALGVVAIAYSAYRLHIRPIGWSWLVLALLTLLSGWATVRLPSVPATISISETFVFTSVLLFGPAAGTLTVALDVLTISLWLARRGHPTYRLVFNTCALPGALWVCAQLFYLLAGVQPLALSSVPVQIGSLVLPLAVFALAYFLLNSWLIAVAIFFETNVRPLTIWKNNFALLSLNYFGGASVAALLVTYTRNLDYTYLAFVLPLLAVLYFTFSMAMGRVEDSNKHLSELNTLYMATIETLAMAIDAKDQITHGHIRRVQGYAVGLAEELGLTDSAQISAIKAASLLHDMGKLAVPEYILNKPGPLTAAEFAKMKMHASVGADILSAIEFPYPVVPIVRHHHENWDGSGYPDGLAGAEIPIGARILSVVDCFDALTSDRPYRPRLPDSDALKILQERRGTMYDPIIVDTFIRVHDRLAPSDLYSTAITPLRAITQAVAPAEALLTGTRLDEIAASTEEMLTLFDLARSLSPTMTTTDVADIMSKHVRRLIPCSLCVFYVYDAGSDELIAQHVSGESSGLVTGLKIPRGQRLSGWVAANRQTIRNSDPVLDFGESARAMTPRPRSCLSTCLATPTELVGVLSLYSTNRDAFSDDHKRLVEIIAHQVAPVLKHAAESDVQRVQLLRDSLTGLPNLSQFVEFSTSARDTSSATPASLLLIDVDNLKRINEKFGRLAGDQALNHVVTSIRHLLRPSDVLFRHEDDQFIVVLLHTPEEVAEALAVRLSRELAMRQSELGFPVTAKVIAVSAPTDANTFQGLLAVARERLSAHDGGHDESGVVH